METITDNQNATLPDANNAKGIDKKRVMILTAALVGLLVIMGIALFGYIWWKNAGKSSTPFENSENASEKITQDATKGTLPSLSTNPLDGKPNLNPAEQSNPINSVKINPFEP